MAIDRGKISQQGEKLVAQGKIDAAIAQYELLVKDNPRDLNTINKIGDLYARAGKKREAILQFNKIGEHYARDGFFLKAIAIYKKIAKLDPAHLDTCRRLAELYSQQGLVLEARSQFQTIAEQYRKAGDEARALESYRALVKLDPENLDHRRVLADLLVKLGHAGEAVGELMQMASQFDQQGKTKEAAACYKQAAVIQPDSPLLVSRLAAERAAADDIPGAIRLVTDAISRPGTHVELLGLLGELHSRAGAFAEARAAYSRALDAAPARSDYRMGLARAHRSLGDAPAAFETLGPHIPALIKEKKGPGVAELLEELLTMTPGQAEPLRRLVDIYSLLQDRENSIRCSGLLLDLCRQRGDLMEARRVAESLVRLCPDDPSHRQTLDRLLAMDRPAESPGIGSGMKTSTASQSLGGSAMNMESPVGEDLTSMSLDEEPEPASEADIPAAPGERAARFPVSADIPLPPPLALEPDDEDFIAEHMTEADVFVKYGLADRAVEQLAAVVERFPAYAPAHIRLKEIYLEEGNRSGASQELVALVKAYLAAGDTGKAEETLCELKRHDPESTDAAMLEQTFAAQSVSAPAPPESDDDAGAIPASSRFEAEEERVPSREELAQVDDYLARSMRNEAVELLRRLASICGSHPDIVGRMRIAMALNESAPVDTHQATEEGEEFEIIVLDGEEEPDDMAPPPSGASSPGVDLSDLAAEIDAALAGHSVAEEAVITGSEAEPEGHSLEEIVEAFKRGVEQQIGSEDFDTHYSLGIAYKEMGLIDEAIGEFQFAAKEARLLVDCACMLGICFRAKGMGSLAVKWYRRGLEACSPHDEDTMLGLRYDLADLLAETGQHREALELFTEIFGVNSLYRDVSARIRDLEIQQPR